MSTAVNRGRATTGECEDVRTGADSECSQRGGFSFVRSKLARVCPCDICVAVHCIHMPSMRYSSGYDRIEESFNYLSRVFAKVRFSKCTSPKIVPKAAFAVHF